MTSAQFDTPSIIRDFAHITRSAGTRAALSTCSVISTSYLIALLRNNYSSPARAILWKSYWPLGSRKHLMNIDLQKEIELDEHLFCTQTLRRVAKTPYSREMLYVVTHMYSLIAASRGFTLPCFENDASFNPRRDDRFVETLLFHKIIDDPDYPFELQLDPSKAAWDTDYFRKDAVAYLVEKLKAMLLLDGKLPVLNGVFRMHISALEQFEEIWEAEVRPAAARETEHMLRCIIEPNIDQIAADKREMKPLRKARNIISICSDDLEEGYWSLSSTMEFVMNNKHRKKISEWIPTLSTTLHTDLTHGNTLEEFKNSFESIYADFLNKEWKRPNDGLDRVSSPKRKPKRPTVTTSYRSEKRASTKI
ncbi:hypothetical protein K458DRAFT_399326 [Lentithecium fluviatile CBS 122367]|uniref:Uncharacterized protein n=1 Tax=Lentithecium fluviatile CBS 122367 TaxID=1168545 RepID=A0A6G1JIC8_9PLEO|nr:hypothetical protein K458DRAFT_399326 [Lentithecium fluviatile CBS 122367]